MAQLATLFAYLEARNYTDLQLFDWPEVHGVMQADKGRYPALLSPIMQKKLSYLLRYAKLEVSLTSQSTIPEMRKAVDDYEKGPHTPLDGKQAEKTKSALKIEIPDLPKWDGTIPNLFPWKETTMDKLGKSGLLKYIGDATAVTSDVEMSEAVFFALRLALSTGGAKTIADKLLSEGKKDPMTWYSGKS